MEEKSLIDNKVWFDQETDSDAFQDKRLAKRFRILLEQLWKGRGQPIPLACQD